METWRILKTPQLSGALNMAIDYTIADFVQHGKSLPTLRLYDWNPPCISLGYHQNVEKINLQECKEQMVDVVRRPTGGKAVYHAGEITYSVIASSQSRIFQDSIAGTFSLLAGWLQETLLALGIHAKANPPEHSKTRLRNFHNPSCFSTSSDYEITVQGKKIVGSAQRRWPGAVLQHGSFLFTDEYLKIVDLLNLSSEERTIIRSHLQDRTISLSHLLPSLPNFQDVAELLAYYWCKRFPVHLIPGELTEAEREAAMACKKDFQIADHSAVEAIVLGKS